MAVSFDTTGHGTRPVINLFIQQQYYKYYENLQLVMADKVQFYGRIEGQRFLEQFEKDFIKMNFERFFVHSCPEQTLRDNTVYSYCYPEAETANIKSNIGRSQIIKLDALSTSLRQGANWDGCKDRNGRHPITGDIVFLVEGDTVYASYFYERNILFTCDLAHAWESLDSTTRKQISTEVWKVIVSAISEFQSSHQIKKSTSRVALVLEDWGRPV